MGLFSEMYDIRFGYLQDVAIHSWTRTRKNDEVARCRSDRSQNVNNCRRESQSSGLYLYETVRVESVRYYV